MDYRNLPVLVVGMARSGVAAAALLARAGAIPYINDRKTASELGDALKELPEGFVDCLGQDPVSLLDRVKLVVISPAVPVTAPVVKAAKAAGIPVIAEIELAYTLCRGAMCAVTGTNGKTTTVSLLGEIYRNAGFASHVVGNIGYPYSWAAIEAGDRDKTTVEVSSFQLETIDTFHPHAAALLNITEDHLNRHGTMEEYIRLKRRVFENMDSNDVAVLNYDDETVRATVPPCPVAYFSRKERLEEGAWVKDGIITVSHAGTDTPVCPASEVFIPGPHNLENALAATMVATAMGITPEVIARTLRTFRGVEHRIETVETIDGVTYINDSKGTNVDSTVKAVETMTRPTAIILGGYDKHCDFAPLARCIKAHPQIALCIVMGDTANQIEKALRDEDIVPVRATDMADAIRLGRENAKDGWNVLLSPACASFDMFSDYEQRGRVFKEIVRAMK